MNERPVARPATGLTPFSLRKYMSFMFANSLMRSANISAKNSMFSFAERIMNVLLKFGSGGNR